METAYIISDESACHCKRSRIVIHCDDDAAQVLIVAFQILHNLVDKQQLRAIRNMSFEECTTQPIPSQMQQRIVRRQIGALRDENQHRIIQLYGFVEMENEKD